MNGETAMLKFNVHQMTLDSIVGHTVNDIRNEYTDVLNLPSNVEARIDGMPVSGETRLQAGQRLEFVKMASEKGC
jgi:hypothetical protein